MASGWPARGEIWFLKLQTDPPDKGLRPVVVVSVDARNRHPRASTVIVIPLSTSIQKDIPTHILLPAGETGLQADSVCKAEDISTVLKSSLVAPRAKLRPLPNLRICQIVQAVAIATGCR